MSATSICAPSSLQSLSQAAQAAQAARAAAVPPAVRRGAWRLEAGQAMSLKASHASMLQVRQGRVWVTRDATAHQGSEDLVLAPGESLTVRAGERIVMEPWDGHGATYHWDVVQAIAA